MDATRVEHTLHSDAAQQLLNSDIPARLAYVARDGTPRAIPIGMFWNGETMVMCTTTNSAKVRALKAHPHVALTIDTNEFPPTILLVRGTAAPETVDGIPPEYLALNEKLVAADQREQWEREVRSLYKQMVRITVTPTWAKLIDFEATLPSAVEELVAKRQAQQS